MKEKNKRILGYDPDGMLPDHLGEDENAEYYLDILSQHEYGKELDVFVFRFYELEQELIDNDITHLIYFGWDPEEEEPEVYSQLAERLENMAEKHGIEFVYGKNEIKDLNDSQALVDFDNDEYINPLEGVERW